MIKTTIKLAFRNLGKNKVHSLMNISALAIGFTVFILIGLYLHYEYSWDKHNEKYDRIYRVQQKVNLSTGTEYWTQTQGALARYIRENFPEAENSVFIREAWGEFLSSSYIQTFFEYAGYYAGQSIFDVFSYDFIEGNKQTSLTDPYSIVLSDKLAAKLFPGEGALGKTVELDKRYSLKVTGIFKELPENSSVRPSYIIPAKLFEKTNNWENALNNWTATSFKTYVLLQKGAKAETLERKIAHLLDEYEVLKKQHTLYLLPLKDVFLRPVDRNDYLVAIFLYAMIAVFILLLASVNFVNLTTANSSTRAKEIGVKKVNGSNRQALIRQFLGESVIIALLAMNAAFVLAKLFLPLFTKIIGRELEFNYYNQPGFILVLLGIALSVGLLSGIYPAFFLSSFKIVNVLKPAIFNDQKGKIGLKKILVTFQLFISVFLVISTLMVLKQINYMMSKDRGFSMQNIIYAQFKSEKENGNIKDIWNRLLRYPEIENVTISLTIPFKGSQGRSINWEGSNDQEINTRYNEVDRNFIETFKIEIVKGRNFMASDSGSNKECIINQTAAKTFGWDDPIGKKIYDNKYRVVGIVKDFCHDDLHNKIEPYVFVLHSGNVFSKNIYSIRVKPGNVSHTRQIINDVFEEYFPDDAFEFWFLEDQLYYSVAYKIWNAVEKTFKFFSVLAILISIIGLFSLISFTAKKRTKEMGVRKVLGSKPVQIYLLMAKEYVPLLLVSIILGSIGAFVFYRNLPGAYKYHLQIWEFVYSWLMIVAVVFLTISIQALQVAFSNPVKSLRYE